ncbi:MAG: PAS domain-containing protein [Candidatus Omnitrophica bacterium]|nr:PAS domain-containing protein [Candidatus Omnitrophota bacterium]
MKPKAYFTQANLRVLWLILIVSSIVFAVDLIVPLGVAGGVPYIAVILVSLRSPRSSFVILAAIICTILTIIGYFLSPDIGAIEWMIISNRFLAIAVIWLTAIILFKRKRIEKEFMLRDRAVQSANSAIIITDAKQKDNPIIYVNPAFEKITGYSTKEVIGKDCRFLQGDDQNQKELDLLRTAIRDGKEIRVILRNYIQNGELFWNEVYLAPVKDDLGDVTHFISVESDITLRKQMEDSLKELTQQIIKIQEEERERISREIHDDLGQSLATLKMHIQSSTNISSKSNLMEVSNYQKTIDYINSIIEKTRHIAAGLRPSTLDVLGLIPSLELLINEFRRKKGIEINVRLESLDQVKIKGELINIYRIVQEALTNIIKHANATKVDIYVDIEEDELRLTIKDNGQGLMLNSREKDNYGIGLASMKERATLLGGELNIISEPLIGTSVIVKIPVETIKEIYGKV